MALFGRGKPIGLVIKLIETESSKTIINLYSFLHFIYYLL